MPARAILRVSEKSSSRRSMIRALDGRDSGVRKTEYTFHALGPEARNDAACLARADFCTASQEPISSETVGNTKRNPSDATFSKQITGAAVLPVQVQVLYSASRRTISD